jgi:hypothetical protein
MDLHRWVALLSSWERDSSTSLVYRILSAESLARDQHSVYVVQSDGYGYGYFHFYLNATKVHYVSKRWDGMLEKSSNSTYFELRSLSDFLDETTINDCLLLQLNDN